ncbi:collagen triple helix repeat-containing protein 1-like [Amphiura filiformis]|uniref:collagen triple helix repeat-containing protein 1-like n=1 Tax=Amphiura filiformis TaxID=82378 RepID=UPI003B2105BC
MAMLASTVFSLGKEHLFLSVFAVSLYFVVPTARSECQGPQGAAGPAGPPGPQGNGTNATWYDISPRRNWKQCTYSHLNNGNDYDTVATCQFYKESASTTLFVLWGGGARICCCTGCCARWYFAFDGTECSDPDKIEGVIHMTNFGGADLHRHRTFQGYCNGLSAGWIDVQFKVGDCSGYGQSDRYTGWNSISRIIIEEVPASPYG